VNQIHFLHIPKTAGTALRHALGSLPDAERFIVHEHQFTLADIPVGERVFFAIRDPVSRFVSAFNSRLRKGRPRYDFEWTPIQQRAFQRFSTPNQLAEALSATVADDRHLAASFIQDTILAAPLSYWLRSGQYLLERSDDIVDILLQKELSDDFERLKGVLGLPPGACLPADPVASHRSSTTSSTVLSDVAVRNLEVWYAGDLVMYEVACGLRREIRNRQINSARSFASQI
jgi:Sulfotransferase family